MDVYLLCVASCYVVFMYSYVNESLTMYDSRLGMMLAFARVCTCV